jgi:multiple antibiotic resistance protein
MAMPLLAGPGAIGVVVGLVAHGHAWEDYAGYILAIVLIAATVLVCLELSPAIFKRLGPNGVGALNRIFGFIILAIAVALVSRGAIALAG